MGIDEFLVEKHHVYVTLLYYIRNSMVMHIEDFIDAKKIYHKTMYMYPSYTSGAKGYFPDSSIVFDRFHVIRVLDGTLDEV